MRDWLKAGAQIPDDPELAVDLTAPGYDTARGKRFHGSIMLEHKEDLKARGEAMTFSVKVRPQPKQEEFRQEWLGNSEHA